jgi:tetratricopeptide (TPR) repeat protein
MRRLALLAILLGLCGCGSRSGQPAGEQAADEMPTGNITRAEPAKASATPATKPSGASYLVPRDASYALLSAEDKSALQDAEKQIRDGQLGDAAQILSNLIARNPRNSLAFVLRGEANVLRHNNADAAADFSMAVELDPQNAERVSARGFFRLSSGNTVEALADFNLAIKLDPTNARARNNRGMALLASGEIKESIEDFKVCLNLDPNFLAAYVNRSFAYAKLDRRKEALADLNRALELDPKAAGVYDTRGAVWLQAQEYEKAVADFTQAIKLDSSNPSYYARRRTALTQLKRFDEAQADAIKIEHLMHLASLNQAVFRDRSSPQPYIDRGNYFLRENQLVEALANFNRAIELNPKSVEALTQRARVRLRRDEPQKAIDDANSALKIERREDTYGVRGDAYRKLEQYDKALADYDAAQRIDQDVADTWTLYAQSLKQAGRDQDAAEALRRAADLKALNAPTRVAAASSKPRG